MQKKDDAVVNRIVLLLCAVLVFASGLTLWREMSIARMVADLDRQTGLLGRGQNVGQFQPDGDLSSPRGQLALSLFLARQSHSLPPSARAATLSRARRAADMAIGSRYLWGEAWVSLAYIESQAGQGRVGPMISALKSSYVAAPYLKKAAGWRSQTAIENWRFLDAGTRRHAIEEVVWLALQNPRARNDIFRVASGTDAYQPLLARWRTARTHQWHELQRRN